MAEDSLSLSHSKRIDSIYSMLLDQLSILDEFVGHIEVEHEHLTTQMLEFEKDGLVVAHPAYQDGKYLYLIHPMKGGKRRREYVGADTKKIAEAERRLANYRSYAALERELLGLEKGASKMLQRLSRITNLNTQGATE